MTAIFSLPVRVYYEDTDTGGVVYHSNYLNFMERARTEWLRDMGFEQDELRREHGVIFAVSAASAVFHRPARFNELLSVTVALQRCGAASLTLDQEVRRGPEVLVTGEIRIACIDAVRFVPVAIPEQVADRLAVLPGGAPRRRRLKNNITEEKS